MITWQQNIKALLILLANMISFFNFMAGQHVLVSPVTWKEGAKPLRDWTRAAFDKVTLHIVQNLQNSKTIQTDLQTYKYQD